MDYKNNNELLSLAINGDSKATEALIENNLGLVRSIALRFKDRGVEYEDLVQIGSMGMLKAIRSFDSSKGNAFSTYAVPLIIGEIKRYILGDVPLNEPSIANWIKDYINQNTNQLTEV